MKELFRSLMTEIETIIDKAQAIKDIKCRKWPLSIESKPEWYNEAGQESSKEDLKNTMSLNHYIKSYLERLNNL